jgi:hypothetical protein
MIKNPLSQRLAALLLVVLIAIVIASATWWHQRRGPQAPTEIFEGITYGAEQLEATEEGGGLLHWVRVDLSAPGIELYVTSLDPEAVAQGWQYRLRRIGEVVQRERLAVAVNAALFTSRSPLWVRLSGDLAKGVETVVADHVVSHVWEHTYLLWFDDQLTAHLRPRNHRPRRSSRRPNGVSADKPCGCTRERCGRAATEARIREPQLP